MLIFSIFRSVLYHIHLADSCSVKMQITFLKFQLNLVKCNLRLMQIQFPHFKVIAIFFLDKNLKMSDFPSWTPVT